MEPSCGIGNFMGLVPETMDGLKMYGVELDSISGKIAKQLYQKNNISVQGFETAEYPDSFFDCVIGNVPFGAYKVADRKYDRHNFMIRWINRVLMCASISQTVRICLEQSVSRTMRSREMQGQG